MDNKSNKNQDCEFDPVYQGSMTVGASERLESENHKPAQVSGTESIIISSSQPQSPTPEEKVTSKEEGKKEEKKNVNTNKVVELDENGYEMESLNSSNSNKNNNNNNEQSQMVGLKGTLIYDSDISKPSVAYQPKNQPVYRYYPPPKPEQEPPSAKKDKFKNCIAVPCVCILESVVWVTRCIGTIVCLPCICCCGNQQVENQSYTTTTTYTSTYISPDGSRYVQSRTTAF